LIERGLGGTEKEQVQRGLGRRLSESPRSKGEECQQGRSERAGGNRGEVDHKPQKGEGLKSRGRGSNGGGGQQERLGGVTSQKQTEGKRLQTSGLGGGGAKLAVRLGGRVKKLR